MPGELHDVVQKVGMDASGYHQGALDAIADNIAMGESLQREVLDRLRDLDKRLRGLPDSKTIRVSADVSRALSDIGRVGAALDGLRDRDITVRVRYVTEGEPGSAAGAAFRATAAAPFAGGTDMRDLLRDQVREMQALHDRLADHSNTVYDNTAAIAEHTAAVRDMTDVLAAAGGGRGGGGAAALAGAAAGAAGRGGGAGGGGGGFVPWGGGGWPAVRFWGMMSAEVLSTVVPAAVAAGAAALVGMQGAQQLQNRGQAIYTASEAFGAVPGFGRSAGQFVIGGKYGNALQAAQTAAEGGVYGLAGAGISLLRSGAGQGLIGEGTSTLAMLDRAAAGTVLSMTQGGKGQRITAMLGGGTGYLQQFGDIGANLGNLLLNMAPNLPGVGSDLLGTLTGATGALSWLTGNVPSPLLKGFLTYEAGSRWLPALLGGQGLIGRMLGLRGVGGIGGLIGKAGTGIARLGLGTGLGDAGLGIAGFGDMLAGLSGPELALPLALLTGEWSLLNQASVTPAMRTISGLQQGIAGSGFSGAWLPLAQAVTKVTGLAAASGPGSLTYMAAPTRAQLGSKVGLGLEYAYQHSPGYQYSQAAQGFAGSMSDLIGSGPQLLQFLQGGKIDGLQLPAAMRGVTMGQAFQIAQNALLDIPHAFDSRGGLRKNALAMVSDYMSAILPMTQSFGGFGAAVAGQQIMSSGAMQNLSKVNQAMDSMSQIMSGGPAGMANLFGLLGGTPVTTKPTRAGYQMQVPPEMQAMAEALSSVTTAGGAAAWRTFAGPSGFVASEQANLDQLRTALTLGALTQPQAAGLAGFQIQQMLPMAKQSPAALAMLMQNMSQMGISAQTGVAGGYYNPQMTQAQNYRAAVEATAKIADNQRQANDATNRMTVSLANMPATAQQFVQGMNADIMSQQVANTASSFEKLTQSVHGTQFSKSDLAQFIHGLQAGGVTGTTAVSGVVAASLKQAGIMGAAAKAIQVQVNADTGKAQAQIAGLRPAAIHLPVIADTGKAQAALDALHGRTVTVTVVEQLVAQQAGLAGAARIPHLLSLPGAQTGGLVPGTGSGDTIPAMLEPGEAVVPRYLVPLIAPMLAAHRVPGFGAPMGSSSHFAAGGIVLPPGPGSLPVPSALASLAGELMRAIEDALRNAHVTQAAAQLASRLAQEAAKPAHAHQFAVSVTGSISQAIARTPGGVQGVAQGLLKKLQQEITFARGVQQAAMPGLAGMNLQQGSVGDQLQGYLGNVRQFTTDLRTLSSQGLNKQILQQLIQAGPQIGGQLADSILHGARSQIQAGLVGGLNIPGMDVSPATGQGSVGDQMQSYLGSLQSFQGDLTKLRKAGLNSTVMGQIIGAGPVQGDQLAQSILNSQGGAGQVNSLWNQIGKTAGQIGSAFGGAAGTSMINKVWSQLGTATGQLGTAAASGMYGGNLTTQSGTITNNNISISITAPPGANLLNLSASEMNNLVNQIQKKLQQKAKKNPKTPVKTQKPGHPNAYY